jgi:sugar phosphate isomerase/epimerase
MKLACASGAFSRAIDRGDLTQIEFVELCARRLACDGIVLDVAHFPRTDSDYLAQIAKMAVDLGLDIAAIADWRFFTAEDAGMSATIAIAQAVQAPLISAPLGSESAAPWSAQSERLGRATSLAKAANITLALRNAPGTHAATSADLKRVAKEADSAWLRYGLEPAAFDAASDLSTLPDKVVLLWSQVAADPAAVRSLYPEFRGYLTLDDASGNADAEKIKTRLQAWRV